MHGSDMVDIDKDILVNNQDDENNDEDNENDDKMSEISSVNEQDIESRIDAIIESHNKGNKEEFLNDLFPVVQIQGLGMLDIEFDKGNGYNDGVSNVYASWKHCAELNAVVHSSMSLNMIFRSIELQIQNCYRSSSRVDGSNTEGLNSDVMDTTTDKDIIAGYSTSMSYDNPKRPSVSINSLRTKQLYYHIENEMDQLSSIPIKEKIIPVFRRIESWYLNHDCDKANKKLKKQKQSSFQPKEKKGILGIVIIIHDPEDFPKDKLQHIVNGLQHLRKNKGIPFSILFEISSSNPNGLHSFLTNEQTSQMKILKLQLGDPYEIFNEHFDLLLSDTFPVLLSKDILTWISEQYSFNNFSIQVFINNIRYLFVLHVSKLNNICESINQRSIGAVLIELINCIEISAFDKTKLDLSMEAMRLICKLPSVKKKAEQKKQVKRCIDLLLTTSASSNPENMAKFQEFINAWLNGIQECKRNRLIALKIVAKLKTGLNNRKIIAGKRLTQLEEETISSLRESRLETLLQMVRDWNSIFSNYTLLDRDLYPSQRMNKVHSDLCQLEEWIQNMINGKQAGSVEIIDKVNLETSSKPIILQPSEIQTKPVSDSAMLLLNNPGIKSWNKAKQRQHILGMASAKVSNQPSDAKNAENESDQENGDQEGFSPRNKQELVNWIWNFLLTFEKTFLPTTFSQYNIPLMELFSLDEAGDLKAAFNSQPRTSIIQPIMNPSTILKCPCCSSIPIDHEHYGKCEFPSHVHDTRLTFKILRNSSGPITKKSFHSYDWFAQFCLETNDASESQHTSKKRNRDSSSQDIEKLAKRKQLQARFFQSVAELQLQGLFKVGRRGTDVIEKRFFENPLL